MKAVFQKGLWKQNPILVQLLGLCPALAVSTTLETAWALGLTTGAVLLLSMLLINLYRPLLLGHLRLPTFMLFIVSLTGFADLFMQAFAYRLYLEIGIFIPLITTNCILLAQAETRAAKLSFKETFWGSISYGLGFAWVMLVLGASRELLATGEIAWNESILISFQSLGLAMDWESIGFYPFMLPGGAFWMLGLLLVGKRLIDGKVAKAKESVKVQEIVLGEAN